MRYKIVIWPMMDETLATISHLFDSYEGATDYRRMVTLKTPGDDWDLQGLLRELADQLQDQTP